MPRTTTRNFLALFRQAGITLLGRPPKISDDIQMVTTIDNFAWPGDAIPRSLYAGLATFVPGAAGQHGALEITVNSQNGLIIDAIRELDNPATPNFLEIFIYIREDVEPGFVSLSSPVPRFTSKPGVEATVRRGHINTAALFANVGLFTIQSGLENGVSNFHLTRGRILYISTSSSNTGISPACLWHELPADQPST